MFTVLYQANQLEPQVHLKGSYTFTIDILSNSLPRHLYYPVHIISVFGRLLKTFFLSKY